MSLHKALEITVERGIQGDIDRGVIEYLIKEIQSQDEQEFIRILQEYWIINHLNESEISHKIKETEVETLQGQLKHDPDSYDRKDGLYDRYIFDNGKWDFIGRGKEFT